MVVNAVIAPKMHGEKLHPSVMGATCIIVVGCVTAVAAASHDNNVCDIDALFALYWTGRFVLYALVVGSIVATIYFFIKRAERLHAQFGPQSPEYMAVFRYHRISYAALSGIFGAQSVLFGAFVVAPAGPTAGPRPPPPPVCPGPRRVLARLDNTRTGASWWSAGPSCACAPSSASPST